MQESTTMGSKLQYSNGEMTILLLFRSLFLNYDIIIIWKSGEDFQVRRNYISSRKFNNNKK